MGEFIQSIRRGFASIFRFSGRDTRAEFWPYAIFLYFAATVATWLVMMPELMRMVKTIFQRAAERAAVESEPTPEEIDAMVRRHDAQFRIPHDRARWSFTRSPSCCWRRQWCGDSTTGPAGLLGPAALALCAAAFVLAPASMETFRDARRGTAADLFATFLNGMVIGCCSSSSSSCSPAREPRPEPVRARARPHSRRG